MERMARNSGDPAMLRELFDALGNDAFLIAETLVRPVLADQMIRSGYQDEMRSDSPTPSFAAWWESMRRTASTEIKAVEGLSVPASVDGIPCTPNTWRAINASSPNVPPPTQYHSAVWTGAEMIVWGGWSGPSTGARYIPATDTWLPVTTIGAPEGRH
jgi:hypothetical protein